MPLTGTVDDAGVILIQMSEDCQDHGAPASSDLVVLDFGAPVEIDNAEFQTDSMLRINLIVPPATEDVTVAFTNTSGQWETNSTGLPVADFGPFPLTPI